MESTIIILVKAVIPSTRDGKTVSAVIKSRICNDSEYVVPTLRYYVLGMAGTPSAPKSWAVSGADPINVVVMLIVVISLFTLARSH